jgi:hypothetical protein
LEKHPVREHARQLTSLAQKQEAPLEKLCNAIGLPPMLCVFVVLGVHWFTGNCSNNELYGVDVGWPGVGNAIAVSQWNRCVVIAARHPCASDGSGGQVITPRGFANAISEV